jgi:cytochrome c oxidase assembly protein subunit 11
MGELELKRANRSTAIKLVVATTTMFFFGYALIPLYDVFCEITGLNGKTGRLSSQEVSLMSPDESRLIDVEFVASVGADLPWEFYPVTEKIRVSPGVETQVDFVVINTAQYAVTGNAVPSVAPNAVAKYFNKTECFCFTKQLLMAGELKRMPIRFIIDPDIPKEVSLLTLGYTFFEALDTAALSTPQHSYIN